MQGRSPPLAACRGETGGREENLFQNELEIPQSSMPVLGIRQSDNSSKSMNRKKVNSEGAKKKKKKTGLSLTYKKDENFGKWYSEVVVSSEMIEYYDISGCYILRPWTIAIWETLQIFFDAEMKNNKIKNASFPLLVTMDSLYDWDPTGSVAPKVAWVTSCQQSALCRPLAVRPTSETTLYPYFSKWIRGHRDLPLKLNHWCNVVQWESTHLAPFIRSREFLWQEGHTAFSTKAEADQEVLKILELYRRIYEDYLAVPVVQGWQSDLEKFAGGLYSTSVEIFIPNTGRRIQGAASHCLGQSYANTYDITFLNEKGEKKYVWQNSWSYSTRTIGVMVMLHGDDKGLVLPPKVASVQVIVIPVPKKNVNKQAVFSACSETVDILRKAGFRVEEDLRHNYTPGWKFYHWEMKGVPIRIEIGPRELVNNQVRIVRRDSGEKLEVPRRILSGQIKNILIGIQESLFSAAKRKRDACITVINTWEEFIEAFNDNLFILAPWCDEEEFERVVKARTKGGLGAAKILCTPFDQPRLDEGVLCFASGKPAKKWTYWGRSY